MLKNRSDLALAEFEDANKCAPNWGRLHTKWGEALGYIGRKAEARAQHRIASMLDLSVADKAELSRDMRGYAIVPDLVFLLVGAALFASATFFVNRDWNDES
jgi:hypothetical protein